MDIPGVPRAGFFEGDRSDPSYRIVSTRPWCPRQNYPDWFATCVTVDAFQSNPAVVAVALSKETIWEPERNVHHGSGGLSRIRTIASFVIVVGGSIHRLVQ